jgi:uncharacterized membrane protein
MGMSTILIVHITGGAIAILSGAVAVLARKGERVHRAFGAVFVIAMLIMATTATYMAIRLGQVGNMFAGPLVLYLVGTSWMAVRRKENTIGTFEYIAFVVALVMAGLSLYGGISGLGAPPEQLGPGGVPARTLAFAATILGSAIALAALFDLKVIIKGGIAGAQRIARHLWRMCLAFFVASGSFFLGQMKVMPAWVLQYRPVLYALAFAPLAFLVFWMIKVRLTKWYARTGGPDIAHAKA